MRYIAVFIPVAVLSCGKQESVSSAISVPFTLTESQCRSLANNPPIQARLIIQDQEETCPLTVTLSPQGQFLTAGTCNSIPVGRVRDLTLQWFVVSPIVGNEIVIAESTGKADLSEVKQRTIQINFDDTNVPMLKPKTKAQPNETPAEKDRFNCDRSGQFGPNDTPCDSKKIITQTPGADKDNCSNLEELCKDTLFKATDDTDCN